MTISTDQEASIVFCSLSEPCSQDGHFHARSKGADELLNYQKLATENPFLETHIRTEFYKSSLDTVQALKQLAEHLMYEIEKATAIKSELENDKALFDAYLKKLRNEYKVWIFRIS